MNSNNSTGPTLLLIAFVVLKLCGVIAWSWWWVLSPAWIPIALLAIFAAVWAGYYGILKLREPK